MKSLFIFAVMVTLGLNTQADSLDDGIKAFTAALKADTSKNTTDPEMSYRLAMQFQGTASPGANENNLEQMVRQMMANSPIPAVQDAGNALLTELKNRKKARMDAATAKVDEVLARATDILAKAEKTQELDSLLVDLQKVEASSGRNYDPDTQLLGNRINTAYQFVAQWQDYLSARNSGNIQAAQETLRNLLNSQRNGDASLVPRSEILARSVELATQVKNAQPAAVPSADPRTVDDDAVLNGIKTLDDLEPAMKAYKAQPNYQSATTTMLGQIASLYAMSKNGLPISLDFSPSSYSNSPPLPQLERIRAMLCVSLLPRFIGSTAPAFNPNEPVDAYLDRVTKTAVDQQDWVSLQRIIEARSKIARVQNGFTSGARSFVAALNQEMAGQYPQAVASYQSSLREPDDFVPAKVAGDRLAMIKKDHPAEFEEGMKTINNPPAPLYYNPAMMRSMMGYPGTFPTAPGVARPGLPEPARSAPMPATNVAPPVPAPAK